MDLKQIKRQTNCTYVHSNRFEKKHTYTVHEHVHTTWQAEHVFSGDVVAMVGGHEYVVASGESLLLPPDIPHQFVYGPKGAEVFSVKFAISTIENRNHVYRLRNTLKNKALWDVLKRFSMSSTVPDGIDALTVNFILDALVLRFVSPEAKKVFQSESAFVMDIKNFIVSSHGQPVTVKDVACHMHCSEQLVRRKFKAETGMQVKKYIDRTRAGYIEQFIAHSDLSLKEIAYHFEFPDTHTFSRFINRVKGWSPRNLRRNIRRSNNLL